MDELALIVAVVVLLFIVLIGPFILLAVLLPAHAPSIFLALLMSAVFVPFAIWMFLRGSRHPEWTVWRQLSDIAPFFGFLLIFMGISMGIRHGLDAEWLFGMIAVAASYAGLFVIPFLLGRTLSRRRLARTSEERQVE